jgi:hypothetical protein
VSNGCIPLLARNNFNKLFDTGKVTTMEKTLEDIGVYTDIHESGNVASDRHKLYYATCKICGSVVEKRLVDLKRNNTICYHQGGYYQLATGKKNDMPKGWINQSKLNQRIYDMWKAMLARTTEKYWDKYPCYTGTTVDDRWRILSNFVNDIKELDGYDKWIISSGKRMMLDKDTIINGNKHYSKDTCCFITHAESNRDVAKRHPENLKKAKLEYSNQHSMPVSLTNINTKEVINYPSLKEASRRSDLTFEQLRKAYHSNDINKKIVKEWLVENPTITTIQN